MYSFDHISFDLVGAEVVCNVVGFENMGDIVAIAGEVVGLVVDGENEG